MDTYLNLLKKFLMGLTIVCATALANAYADTVEFGIQPTSNSGKPWRIAYYEGGEAGNYYENLWSTIQGLRSLGWIENTDIPTDKQKNSRLLWQWLSKNASNEYVHFLMDGYYSANWDNDLRAQIRDEVIDRSNKRRDIDLIIAMGTWAGKDLANNRHSTPTMVMSTSDPLGAGIIQSVADSGFDHVHARVDPGRYERQVRVFHNMIKFKKLGIAYEDSVNGRSYAALDAVEKVAKETGFELVRCHTLSDIADQQLAGESVVRCFEELAANSDAIYVTMQGGVNADTLPQLVKIALENRIPTFSQLGAVEVKCGFLFSLSRPGFRPVGMFLASTMARVMNGAKPRQLPQLFEDAPNIAINLKTAEYIGLYLYADILAAADQIFRKIDVPL